MRGPEAVRGTGIIRQDNNPPDTCGEIMAMLGRFTDDSPSQEQESPPQVVLRGHEGTVHSVVFSPDGAILASGSCDGTIKLWDVAAGRERMTLRGHTGWIFA